MNELQRKQRELEIWEEQLLNKQKELEKKEMELIRREKILKEREEMIELKETSQNKTIPLQSNQTQIKQTKQINQQNQNVQTQQMKRNQTTPLNQNVQNVQNLQNNQTNQVKQNNENQTKKHHQKQDQHIKKPMDDTSMNVKRNQISNQNFTPMNSNITQSVPNPHCKPPQQSQQKPIQQSINPYMPSNLYMPYPSQQLSQSLYSPYPQEMNQINQINNNQNVQQKQTSQYQQNNQNNQQKLYHSVNQKQLNDFNQFEQFNQYIPNQQQSQIQQTKQLQQKQLSQQFNPLIQSSQFNQSNNLNNQINQQNQGKIIQQINPLLPTNQINQNNQQINQNKFDQFQNEFEEIPPNYECEELLDEDLRAIQEEMENERKQEEIIKEQVQRERNEILDGNDTIENFVTRKPSSSTKVALSLFGSSKSKTDQLPSPKRQTNNSNKTNSNNQSQQTNQTNQNNQTKQKQRFSTTMGKVCSYPNCKGICNQSHSDFCVCSLCNIGYCEQHKQHLQIIIPTFKNLTSKKQTIQPYVVCSRCKTKNDIYDHSQQERGTITDKFAEFTQRRKQMIDDMKVTEEMGQDGLGKLVTRIQTGKKLFSRKDKEVKESGKNSECCVCEVFMNGNEHMNVTCDICLKKCCVGCSKTTSIAPTLIMGIQDPNAEFIKVTLCKKCYQCTNRKTLDTRIELQKNDQTLINAHQKLMESEQMLYSLLKQLDETTERFQTLDDIKMFEQKEMFYVDGLNEVTNVLTQYKKQKEMMEKDKKSVMNNIIIAFSTLVHNVSLKHGIIFTRYTNKVKQLSSK